MAFPSYVSSGANVVNVADTTLELNAPTCQTNDILIAIMVNKALSVVITAPDATWSQIYQADADCTTAADDHRAAIFWKRAVQADSGAQFVFTKGSGTTLFMGNISAFRGCEEFDSPLDATAVGATVTAGANENVAFPAFDPTFQFVHIVYVAFYGNDLTTFAAAMSADVNPDCTTRFDNESSSGNDASIAMTTGNNDGSNIASRTWDSNSTTDAGSTGVVFALVPPMSNYKFNNYQFVKADSGISVTEKIR